MTSTVSPVHTQPAISKRASWLGVTSMGMGIFTLVTSEFLPAGLLSPIAADLGISEGTAGQAVTATAIMGALVAPTIAVVIPRMDRRTLLMALTGLAVVSNLLVAIAPQFWVLVVARVFLGIAIAGFWAMSLAVTAQLVPANRLGRAMMIVNSGLTLATVAAIPLGTYLGDLWGWRWVFVLAAATGIVAIAFQALALPSVAPTGAPGLRSLADTARSRVVIRGLIALGLIGGGHFAAFTYIRPAAQLIPGLTVESLAVLLVTYGIGGVLGNFVSGPLADRRLRMVALLAPLLIGVGTILLAFATVLPTAVAAAALWGFAFGAVPTVVQTWMARAVPEQLESAGGLVVATFQTAIAVGAAVGGLVIDVFDVRVVLIGGGIAAIAGGVILSTARRLVRG